MRTFVFILSALLSFISLNAQHNDLLWVNKISGNGNSNPVAVVEDSGSNIYVLGNYRDNITQGNYSFTAVGGTDIFVGKYNTHGQVQWLISIGGSLNEFSYGMAISPDGNYIYIGGQFQSNDCDFGGTSLASSGLNDVFIAKYNTSDGSLVWAIKSAYGTNQQSYGYVNVDNEGNLIQLGKYATDVTFYGGTTTLTSSYGTISQNYIAKFDENGNLIWAKQFKGKNSNSLIRTVTSDNNYYYFSGQFTDSLYLDMFAINSTSSTRDIVLFRTDLDGNVQWVRKVSGTADEFLYRHYTDSSSFHYLAGYYTSPLLTIDSTATDTSLNNCPNQGSNDIFLACYAFDGTLQWVRTYGSTGDDKATGVYANADHLIFTGSYTGNISFGQFNLTNSSTDAFMLETDRNGSVLGVNKASGSLNDYCINGIINANNTNTFIGYFYSGTFNIGNKTLTNPNTSTTDAFIAKFGRINTSFTITNNICYGDSSGTIDLTVEGDALPPYTYAWSGPNGFSDNTEDINQLKAGWYKVTITDANNAQKVDSAYVSEGTPITLTFNVTQTSCFGSNDGAVDLSVSGGVSPYTFNWSNGSNAEDINGLTSGTYHVTVIDNNGCKTIDSVFVPSPQQIEVTETLTPPSCSPGGDGSIDIDINGGTPPYTFQWSTGDVTEDLNGLDANIYTVTITDANNCTLVKTYNLFNPNAPSISYIVTPPSCSPGNDGEIDLIVSGGTIPFTYIWLDGDNNEDRVGLAPGTYSVTVIDNNNCSSVKNDIIVPTSNPPSLSVINQNVTCIPGNDGSIDLIVYNGTAPFTYNWSNGNTTEDISGLPAGIYTVTVSDSKNCTAVLSTELTTDTPSVNITYNGNTTFCEGDSLILYATNGSDYTFDWYHNGTSLGVNVPVVSATQTGNYNVVVTNASGCIGYSDTISIVVNPKPSITINASSNYVCEGTPVLLTATGASSYVWSNGSTANPDTITPTTTTVYSVTGTDANGCSNVAQTNIIVNTYPVVTGVVTDETCQAGTGAIDITVSGGQPPYTFNWSNSATSEDITNLNAGTYSVSVTSAANCTTVYSATVNAYTTMTANINTHSLVLSCSSIPNGEAHVTANGGVPPYSYSWSNNVNTSYNSQIGVGVTYVTVTDQCNTIVVDSIVATSLPPLQTSIVSSSQATCSTSADGSAEVFVTGGVQPYAYAWSNSSSTTNSANDLAVGWQYVTVTDYCGSVIDSVLITNLPPMQATISSSTPVTCAGLTDGTATVTITDGVAPFSYSWSNGDTTQTTVQLPQGLNSVTVTDACGWVILSVNTGVQSPMTINIISSSPSSCPTTSDGSATVEVNDGSGPYSILWSSGDTLPTATHLSPGWNYVTVTDACTSLVDSVNISFVEPVQAIITFTEDATCSHSSDGKAFVSVQNGVAPYSYAWSNSSSTSNIALDLSTGWHYVTVTDQCTTLVDSVEIGFKTPLQATISYIQSTDCYNDSTGMVIVTPTYGVPPYTYTWSYGNDNDSILQNLPVGNYTVTVSDFCGSIVVPFTIDNITPLSVNYEKEDVTCFGYNNGSIVLVPEGGVSPFTYTWANSIEIDSIRTNLSAGIYNFTITDKCGSVSDSVIIQQPDQLSILSMVTNVSFSGLNDGEIDLLVYGGTAPYSYVWSTGDVTEDLVNITEGIYYVTVTDNNGCTVYDSIIVRTQDKRIEIYNAFTPNGDGKNDVWNIKHIDLFPDCEVVVYDQWGVKVFESKGYTTPWDGTKDGKALPAATYYYIIDLKNGEPTFTGSVTIMK